jgi:hypothetical protein
MRESKADGDQDLQFGRGKPHLGGLSESVETTVDRKDAALKEQSLWRAETRRHHKADRA